MSVLAFRPIKNPNFLPQESLDWVNMLLRVFYKAWSNSLPFKRLVLEEIYIAVNLNRPQSISEILIVGLDFEGAPPELKNVKLLD